MNHRRKVLLVSAAALAVGFAFAAQSTDSQGDWPLLAQGRSWVPGTDSPMSAFEPRMSTLPSPQ